MVSPWYDIIDYKLFKLLLHNVSNQAIFASWPTCMVPHVLLKKMNEVGLENRNVFMNSADPDHLT